MILLSAYFILVQANAISIVNHFLSYHAEHIADHEGDIIRLWKCQFCHIQVVGRFPLHWAAMQGDVQIVDLLISRDINVNLVDAQVANYLVVYGENILQRCCYLGSHLFTSCCNIR